MYDLREILIDPHENITAIIGNSYAQTFLSTGQIGKGFAVLSDRRVYFKGKCLYKTGKKYSTRMEERVVDLNDVTGSGFIKFNPIYLLVMGIIMTVITLGLLIASFTGLNVHAAESDAEVYFPATGGSIVGGVSMAILAIAFLITSVILLTAYFRRKTTIFKIDYAGGSIGFDLRLISYGEAESFNRSLRTCKDNAVRAAQTMFTSVNQIQTPTYGAAAVSTADALREYNNLLSQGIITQEDYEAKKRQLLGL